jgi:TolB-like protein/cytochrome c-type biogenesis protein CcmH/NrfG
MNGLGSADIFQFEGFRFDRTGGCLFRMDGPGVAEPIILGSRALALLGLLVERQGQLVSKDQIFAAVWPGIAVEEANLTVQISALRRMLDRDRDDGSYIQTVPGRGYRLVALVTRVEGGARSDAAARLLSGVSVRPRLSIVVLPFTNLSNDPEQEYFVDGVTDDLTTDLSRISGSFVIARNTAFTYKGTAVDAKQIGRELGVRYILEGSVQRAGEDIRVNVQLVDAEGGAHLWADRFDTDRRNLVDAQREITGRLARSLNLELVKDIGRRIEQEGTVDPEARDLVMRGYGLWYRPRSVAHVQEAMRLFESALQIDPRSIDARIGIAKMLAANVTQNWTSAAAEDTARAERLLLEVLEQDTGSSLAHSTMGMVRRFQNRLTESRFEFETAIVLDPNDTYAHIQLGWVLLYLGDPAAVVRCEKAMRLSPRDPQLWGYHLPLGWCRLLVNEVDPAVDRLIRSRALNPRLWHIHFALAAALGLSGASEDAKTALAAMLKLKPEASSLAQYRDLRPWGNPRYWELFEKTAAAGLRRVGFRDR